jgi:hypothetical protein
MPSLGKPCRSPFPPPSAHRTTRYEQGCCIVSTDLTLPFGELITNLDIRCHSTTSPAPVSKNGLQHAQQKRLTDHAAKTPHVDGVPHPDRHHERIPPPASVNIREAPVALTDQG